MPITSDHRLENFEQWRQHMLDETSRFVEWGLAHPEQFDWIPRHPVGLGGFSERVKTVFWGIVWSRKDLPD